MVGLFGWILYLFSDDTWYITKDIDDEEGKVKSLQSKDVLVPQFGWSYYDQSYFQNDFDNCKTMSAVSTYERC